MLCCFGGSSSSSAARSAHRRNTRQTASQIDAFVLPERTIDLDINPDTVPLPTPAATPRSKPSRKSLRRPPSPADPVLPDVQSTSSSRRGGRPSVDSNNTYPPTMSPRPGRAPASPLQPAPPADHAPRLVSYHRPGSKGSKPTSPLPSSRRPSSANRSQTSGLTQSQTTSLTASDVTATGGRVLSGPSTDEKRPRRTRRQHSTPQLHSTRTSSDAQRRPPTAPASPAYNQHLKSAHSFSSLGTAPTTTTASSPSSSRPLPQPKGVPVPLLPPVAPTSPLLGSTDWLPFRSASRSQLHLPSPQPPPPPPPPQPASPVLLPSASPIVVHRVTTSSRARHIDLLTGTVLQPGQDPPPRYEAG